MESKSIQQEFIETSIRKVHARRKLFFYICMGAVLLVPIAIFVATMRDTYSLGRELLGEERFGTRMLDSYRYSGLALLLCGLLMLPVFFMIHSFASRYLKVLPTLSSGDILKAEALNQHLGSFQKYLLPYVFRGEEVILFQLMATTKIPLRAITRIQINHVTTRGGSTNILRISTPDGNHKFGLDNNSYLLSNLLRETLEVNSRIEIVRKEGLF